MRRIFSNIPLKTKLIGSTSFLLLLAIALGAIGQSSVRILKTSIATLYNASKAGDYLAQATTARSDLLQYLWFAYSDYHTGKPAPAGAVKDITDTVSTLEEKINNYGAENKLNNPTAKEQELFNKIQEAWGKFKGETEKLVDGLKTGKIRREELKTRITGLVDVSLTMNDAVSESSGNVQKKGRDNYELVLEMEKKDRVILLLAIVLGSVLGLGSIALVLGISRRMATMSHSLEAASTQVGDASKNIGVMGQALAERVTEQAAALDESVSSMDEMSSMIAQTAKSAGSALQNAELVQKESNEGVSVVQDLQRSMTEISAANTQLETINEVIKQISAKTAVINDIVFETRLLSFNASIEAARAGQHGRGFAVVAEEVGNLAKMSGKAAEEIRELLDRSIAQVNKTIAEISEKVKIGQSISVQCSNAFGSVTESINKLTPMVNAIATAAKEQELGVSQSNKALEQMDLVTNQNAKSAEELAQWGKKLRAESGNMEGSVSELIEIVLGGRKSGGNPSVQTGAYAANADTSNVVPLASAAKAEVVSSGGMAAKAAISPRTHELDLPLPDDPRFK